MNEYYAGAPYYWLVVEKMEQKYYYHRDHTWKINIGTWKQTNIIDG